MSIRKWAWTSCVLATLSLSMAGCMMDATGGDEDGPLGSEGLQLLEAPVLPPAADVVDDDEDVIDDGEALGGERQGGESPMPGDLVANGDDPNEPHPDPWRVAPPTAPDK